MSQDFGLGVSNENKTDEEVCFDANTYLCLITESGLNLEIKHRPIRLHAAAVFCFLFAWKKKPQQKIIGSSQQLTNLLRCEGDQQEIH